MIPDSFTHDVLHSLVKIHDGNIQRVLYVGLPVKYFKNGLNIIVYMYVNAGLHQSFSFLSSE